MLYTQLNSAVQLRQSARNLGGGIANLISDPCGGVAEEAIRILLVGSGSGQEGPVNLLRPEMAS